MTLPDVLKVHSDGTDVAGIARIDRANLDNLGYLVPPSQDGDISME